MDQDAIIGLVEQLVATIFSKVGPGPLSQHVCRPSHVDAYQGLCTHLQRHCLA